MYEKEEEREKQLRTRAEVLRVSREEREEE